MQQRLGKNLILSSRPPVRVPVIMCCADIISGMTYQINFWLVRSDSCLRLCAAIPSLQGPNDGDAKAPIVTYESPGSFFSRLDTAIFEREKVDQIKTAVIHAIGTLDRVFSIAAIDLNQTQVGTLGLQDQAIR